MLSNVPILFIEINNSNYTFIAGVYDDNKNFKINEKIVTLSAGINKKKFINLDEAYKAIKTSIETIENKLDFVFKEVTIIIDAFNCSCTNISGFKKLNGSQIFKENISYILNSLKSLITENENKNKILHIFNSKSILDGVEVKNLPIGLFGDFYIHNLTFFFINDNDLKNIKFLFNKHNIEVKKIFLKDFVEGAQLIELKNHESFLKVKIDENSSNISFFYNSAFVYSEDFDYGSNIVYQDIEKICLIDKKTIKNFFNDSLLNQNSIDKDEVLEKKYFINGNFRKIRKKLIFDIAEARIEEITNRILNKNTNIKNLKFDNFKIFMMFQDKIIEKNFEKVFDNFISQNNYQKPEFIDTFSSEIMVSRASKLSVTGWRNEAIPVAQQKKSLITKLFKLLFD